MTAAQAQTPLSLLAGLSTTLREPVLDAMTDASTVTVVVQQDELPRRGVLMPDRRNVAELTARQIEYADVCVLANAHRGAAPERLHNLLAGPRRPVRRTALAEQR